MGAWHKLYSLLPYVYFTDVRAGETVLVITDVPERCQIGAFLPPVYLTFFCPAGCVKNLQHNSRVSCVDGDWEQLGAINKNVSTIIWDMVTPPDVSRWQKIQNLFPELRTLVILEERKSLFTNLKNIWSYWNKKSAKPLINKKLQFGEMWQQRWFLVVFPRREKPRTFLLPGFATPGVSESRFAWKRWFDRHGGLFLLPHYTASVFTHSSAPDVIRHAICKLIGCGENETDIRNYIRQIYISTTNVLMVRIRVKNVNYFIRYPFHVLSLERIQNNQRLIRLLHENGFTDVPNPVDEQPESDFPYFVEVGIDAFSVEKRFSRLQDNEAVDYVQKAMERISRIHRHFGLRFSMDESTFEKYVGIRLKEIRSEEEDVDLINRIEQYLKNEFLGKTFMHSICHGDYKIGNCLFDENGELLGIIDWDMGSLDDLTLVDVASLIARALRQRKKLNFVGLLREPNMEGGIFQKPYLQYFKLTGTDPVSLFPTLLFYWIDRVYKQFKFSPDGRKTWARYHVRPVLKVLQSIL